MSSDVKVANTIPDFKELPGEIGCLNFNGEIDYISQNVLDESICSSGISYNIDFVAKHIFTITRLDGSQVTQDSAKEFVLEKVNEVDEKGNERVCFIHNKECSSYNIIKYNVKPLPYIIGYLKYFGIAIIGIIIYYLLCALFYKVLLYIIYGKK
jgi:hypothetical protein